MRRNSSLPITLLFLFLLFFLYKHDWKSGSNYRESHVRLVTPWGNQPLLHRAILNWFHEYEHERLNGFDVHRSRRPRTIKIGKAIDFVRLLIEDDPHITHQQIECSLEINSTVLYLLLHAHLKLQRVCAR